MTNQRSIDFDLLECLQILVAECHVTRAAERLGMTQPRLSGALARLRRVTGDPLLVRTPKGMVPTDLARQLVEHTSTFLIQWNTLVKNDSDFLPESAKRTFNIQAADYLVQILFPHVVKKLRQVAPGISISLSHPSIGMIREQLETGEVDIALGWNPQAPQELYASYLTTYPWCFIAAKHHPRIRGQLDIEALVREQHVLITFGRSHDSVLLERAIDSQLAEQNLKRQTVVYINSVLDMPDIVAATELIGTVPRALAEQSVARLDLQILDSPVNLPKGEIMLMWHARTKNEPAHMWFRNLLREVAESIQVGAR